jgi:hypothetical protein
MGFHLIQCDWLVQPDLHKKPVKYEMGNYSIPAMHVFTCLWLKPLGDHRAKKAGEPREVVAFKIACSLWTRSAGQLTECENKRDGGRFLSDRQNPPISHLFRL